METSQRKELPSDGEHDPLRVFQPLRIDELHESGNETMLKKLYVEQGKGRAFT